MIFDKNKKPVRQQIQEAFGPNPELDKYIMQKEIKEREAAKVESEAEKQSRKPEPKTFNWDDYEDAIDDSISPGVAGLRGAAQGLSLGLADEISGAITGSPLGAAKKALSYIGLPTEQSDEDIKKYIQERDIFRQGDIAASEQQPAAFYGAQIASSAALPLGAGTQLGKLAIMGGIGGLGASEAKSGEDLAKDVAIGAGLGTAAGATISGASALGSKVSSAARAGSQLLEDTVPAYKRLLTAVKTGKTIGNAAETELKKETKQILRELEKIADREYGAQISKLVDKPYTELKPTERIKNLVDAAEISTDNPEEARKIINKFNDIYDRYKLNKYFENKDSSLLKVGEDIGLRAAAVGSNIAEAAKQTAPVKVLNTIMSRVANDPTGDKKRAAAFSISQQPSLRKLLNISENKEEFSFDDYQNE